MSDLFPDLFFFPALDCLLAIQFFWVEGVSLFTVYSVESVLTKNFIFEALYRRSVALLSVEIKV